MSLFIILTAISVTVRGFFMSDVLLRRCDGTYTSVLHNLMNRGMSVALNGIQKKHSQNGLRLDSTAPVPGLNRGPPTVWFSVH